VERQLDALKRALPGGTGAPGQMENATAVPWDGDAPSQPEQREG
jgi:hypothetical protein